jgi:hypothetical protein
MCRNLTIADYLSSNGYLKTLAEFQKEASLVSQSAVTLRQVFCFIFSYKTIGL